MRFNLLFYFLFNLTGIWTGFTKRITIRVCDSKLASFPKIIQIRKKIMLNLLFCIIHTVYYKLAPFFDILDPTL